MYIHTHSDHHACRTNGFGAGDRWILRLPHRSTLLKPAYLSPLHLSDFVPWLAACLASAMSACQRTRTLGVAWTLVLWNRFMCACSKRWILLNTIQDRLSIYTLMSCIWHVLISFICCPLRTNSDMAERTAICERSLPKLSPRARPRSRCLGSRSSWNSRRFVSTYLRGGGMERTWLKVEIPSASILCGE